MSPSRQRQRSLCSVALACVVVLLLASCHGSSKHAAPKGSKPSTNDKGQPAVSLSLGLGALTVQAVGKAVPFNRSIASSIRDVMNKYVDVGITKPLFTGASASAMVAYFAPSLAKRVGPKGHDLAALSDEGMPTIIDVTGTGKAPLSLVGLEDHGRLIMVGARFAITVKGTTAQGPLTISRIGNFVLEPNAKKQWRITGYDIIVNRANSATTTTVKATTTTTAP